MMPIQGATLTELHVYTITINRCQFGDILVQPEPEHFASRSATSPAVRTAATTDLPVGRSDEIQILSSTLDSAALGRGQSVAITGEPGIGKTFLVSLLKESALSKNAVVISCTCTNLAGTPPFWLWRELFAQLPDSQETVKLLESAIPDISAPESSAEMDTRRFEIFSNVVAALRAASIASTLVICVDDLQWADTASRDLYSFVAAQIEHDSILLASSVRTSEIGRDSDISSVLSEGSRLSNFTRVEPTNLDPIEIRQLVESVLGHTVTSDVAKQITERSKGVPLFASELAQIVDNRGQSLLDDLPNTITDVLGSRIKALTSDTQFVLSAAAVLGGSFVADDIEQVLRDTPLARDVEVDRQLFVVAMDEADAAGAVISNPSGLFQFSHPLYAEVARDLIPAGVRAMLHGRAANLLEQRYGSNSATYASELAWHYKQATAVLGAEKMVAYSVIAGQSALRSFAWSEALEHFENVRAALGDDSEEIELAHAWFGIARARHTHQSKWGNSLSASEIERGLELAFNIYLAHGETNLAIEAASQGIVGQLGWAPGTTLVERALDIAEDDSPRTAKLLSRYADVLFSDLSRFEESQGVFDQALEIARRHNDVDLQLNILRIQAQFRRFENRYEDVIAIRDSAKDLLEANPENIDVGLLHMNAGLAECSQGDFIAGERSLELGHHIGDLLGIETILYYESLINIACARADFSTAIENAIEAERLSERGFSERFFRLVNEAYTGDIHQALEMCREAVRNAETSPHKSTIQALYGQMILWIGRLLNDESAIKETAMIADALSLRPRTDPLTSVLTRQIKAKLAAALHDPDEAKIQYETLLPQKGTFDMAAGGFVIDILLGDLLEVSGEQSKALDMFRSGFELATDSGNITGECESAHAYASALIRRGDRVDIANATNVLVHGIGVAKAHGLRYFHDSMQEMLNATTQGRQVHPAGLTAREIEVVQLIATGKSNPQIAEELFISLNTVLRHVSNIFGKLEVSNRTEAGIKAVELGIVEKS
jgi:DNA-binding CsgD family transcriptional regulator